MVPNTQFDVGLPDIDVELDRDSLRPSWEPETVIGIGDVHYQGGPCDLTRATRCIEPSKPGDRWASSRRSASSSSST